MPGAQPAYLTYLPPSSLPDSSANANGDTCVVCGHSALMRYLVLMVDLLLLVGRLNGGRGQKYVLLALRKCVTLGVEQEKRSGLTRVRAVGLKKEKELLICDSLDLQHIMISIVIPHPSS